MRCKPKTSANSALKPIVRAHIGPGVICNYVFDHRVCIHGRKIKQQCPVCLEICAESIGVKTESKVKK